MWNKEMTVGQKCCRTWVKNMGNRPKMKNLTARVGTVTMKTGRNLRYQIATLLCVYFTVQKPVNRWMTRRKVVTIASWRDSSHAAIATQPSEWLTTRDRNLCVCRTSDKRRSTFTLTVTKAFHNNITVLCDALKTRCLLTVDVCGRLQAIQPTQR